MGKWFWELQAYIQDARLERKLHTLGFNWIHEGALTGKVALLMRPDGPSRIHLEGWSIGMGGLVVGPVPV